MAAPASSWLKPKKKLVHTRMEFLALLCIPPKVTGREWSDLLHHTKTAPDILLLLKPFIGEGDPAQPKKIVISW